MSIVYKDMLNAKETGKLNDKVGQMFMRATRAKEFQTRRFNRSLENWRYYLGLDAEYGLGQWAAKVVAYMAAQNRQLTTYNFCKAYVDQIAGGIMQAPFEPEFYPVNAELTTLTEAAKKAMYSDKELMNWSVPYFELVRAGLIHRGVLKVVISDKYHKLGNIGFESVLPNTWWGDPMWVTPFTRDLRICWDEVMLMPDDAIQIYGKIMPGFEKFIDAYRDKQKEYGAPNGPTPFASDDYKWGSALKFVSEYQMMREQVVRSILHHAQGDIEIPDSLPDPAAKIAWLNQRFGEGGWDPYQIEEIQDYKNVCIKRTICPSISWGDFICERPTEVQCDQVPFLNWSSDTVNGEPHGIIDTLKSAQDDVNYTNSMITYKLQTEGGGGGQFMDEAGFSTPEEAEAFKKHRNDPTRTWSTAPGLLVKGGQVPVKPVVKSDFPAEVYNRLNHIINTMLPHISKVVPAYRGQTDQSNTSGYLYNLMKIQADQALYTIHYMLRQFWNQAYEMYLMQASRQYAIEQVERKFTSADGKQSTVFNERIQMADGSIGLRNDASMLAQIRHKIIISEVQETPTKKMEDLNILNDYLRTIAPVVDSKPATVSYITSRMAELIDPLSSVDKEALKRIGDEEVETALAELRLRRAKIDSEMNMILNPPVQQQVPPQTGEPGPGAPAPAVPAQQGQPINQPGPQAQGGQNA
jgi:hypothetical protein